MNLIIRAFTKEDTPAATALWNQIVSEANSFPAEFPFSEAEAEEFFLSQSYTGCAFCGQPLAGLYILHPNNVGRCAHIANASYAVAPALRGQGIGRQLVQHSLSQCRVHGFTGLQFNAVVSTNLGAIHLYRQLGFVQIGTIPNGYRLQDGSLVDIHIFYHDAAK